MARVKLEGVRKVYEEGGHVAVHGVDLEVADGEFVVLVGPSGCGKSTTLRMIAGLETISEGRLWIGDRLVNDVSPADRDIAMVFQSYALYPHMTVYDNMAFALKLRNMPRAAIADRVREAAAILELDGVLDRTPKQLSGGQRQRVAVGRAIVRQPQVFLFDEPLSNLDAKLRVQTRREIAKLHRGLRATMIYVTHDQVEAMTMGDRIVVLDRGRVQQVGTPLELYERPVNHFVAGFIGSPAMNFLTGRVEGGEAPHFVADGSRETLPLPAALAAGAARPVVLGVRPEDVRSGAAVAPGASLTLDVQTVEPMGSETFVNGTVGGQDFTARLAPRPLPRPGDSIPISVAPERIHLFDAETGERVS